MPRHSLALLIGLILFFAPAVLAQTEPLIVDVDCDAGDDLAQVLREIEVLVGGAGSADDEGYDFPSEGPRAIVVQIAGTCVANVTLNMDYLTLRGVGDTPAVIQGDPEMHGTPVVEARYVQHLLFDNLTITGGWIGVRLAHSLVVIHNCRLSGNGTGLQSENSRSIINQTWFEQNRDGIFSFGGDHVLLEDFLVADNTQTGIHGTGSFVTIGSGVIRDNRIGLLLHGNATGLLRANLVIESSVTVQDSSHLSMYGPVTITGDDRIFVANQSLFETFGGSIDVNVLLARWGRAFFSDTPIEGEVLLYDFSEARFDGEVSDLVYCDATSDAICETGSVGGVIGCKHCDGPVPSGNQPGNGFTPPDAGAIRDLLDNLRAPNESPLDGGTSSHRRILRDLPAPGARTQHQ